MAALKQKHPRYWNDSCCFGGFSTFENSYLVLWITPRLKKGLHWLNFSRIWCTIFVKNFFKTCNLIGDCSLHQTPLLTDFWKIKNATLHACITSLLYRNTKKQILLLYWTNVICQRDTIFFISVQNRWKNEKLVECEYSKK